MRKQNEICLYGAREVGFGWLAVTSARPGEVLSEAGPGEDVSLSCGSLTAAVWTAADAIRAAGGRGGCLVFAPCGELVAEVNLDRNVPSFGSLRFRSAAEYGVIITAEQIEALAEREAS